MAKAVKEAVDPGLYGVAQSKPVKSVDLFKRADPALFGQQVKELSRLVTLTGKAIAVTAASACEVAIKYRNSTAVNELVAAVRRIEVVNDKERNVSIVRSNDLIEWIGKNAPVTWVKSKDADGKVKAEFIMRAPDDPVAVAMTNHYNAEPAQVVDAMVATPFNVAKREPEFNGFDLEKRLESLLKQAESMAKETDPKKVKKIKLSKLAGLRLLMRTGGLSATDNAQPETATLN